MKTSFCLSLSCIPARFESLYLTINSLQEQTLKPDKIFLSIPHRFKRFPDIDVNINKLKDLNLDNLEIIRCNDFGPGTSLIGPLEKFKNFD
ncbi:MAG: Megavirus chiliensis, partial [Pseudomonadota bacterium]